MVLRSSTEGINAIKCYAKLGKKYTIALFADKGFVEQRCFTLQSIVYKSKTPQHKNPCMLITTGDADILKWDKFIHLWEGKQFILWEGFRHVNTWILVKQEVFYPYKTGEPVTRLLKWPEFDNRYMHRALKSVKVKPIASYIEPISEEEELITYQCISQ